MQTVQSKELQAKTLHAEASTTPVQKRDQRLQWFWVLVMLGLLVVALGLSVAFGARVVSLNDIYNGLSGQLETISEAAVANRIPRTFLAGFAGAALGLSGAAMQGVTRNPLADPGLLGINSGSALAVVIGVAWVGINTETAYIWYAIVGAAITAVCVYAIASLGRGGATPLKLALAGAATAAALSAFATAIILPRNDIAGLVRSWQMGGVGGATFEQIRVVWPFLLFGLATVLLSARRLNMLALGDEAAAGLGENAARTRGIAAIGAIFLCGVTTAVCGPIAFVGLVVPHMARLLIGPDYRWILPFSALCGAVLLIVADVVGRLVVRPSELDVAVVTAFIGAPVFIWIVRRKKVAAL